MHEFITNIQLDGTYIVPLFTGPINKRSGLTRSYFYLKPKDCILFINNFFIHGKRPCKKEQKCRRKAEIREGAAYETETNAPPIAIHPMPKRNDTLSLRETIYAYPANHPKDQEYMKHAKQETLSVLEEDFAASQPAREENVQALVSYFKRGCKANAKSLGIELEHILVDGTGDPISYSQPHGVRDVLETLRQHYPQTTFHGNDLLGVAGPGMAVTIEPAAQLELSAGPFTSLEDAKRAFASFENHVAEALEPIDGRALAIGYDPVNIATNKELIPKDRYAFMNEYLSAISPYGPRMMRGSAATQISIDYTSESDCVRKMRIASVLSPLFALMCDNAPFFEGSRRPHPLMRTEIWKYCDPDRCNTVPGVFNESFGFRAYAEYILDTPAIVLMDDEGEAHYDTRTFGEIFANRPMTTANVEHALSMVFPDARLKSYVEIRPADAMPVSYVLAYTALIKGLFYNEGNLEALAHSCAEILEADITDAKEALMERGYEAEVYGRPAAEICDDLIAIARHGLPGAEWHYLDPLATLVEARKTLAERAL